MKGGQQLLANFHNGIGAGGTVTAGTAKTAGVEHQNRTVALAEGLVGVAIDHAVGLGKMVPEGRFDIKAQAGAVDEADSEGPEGKTLFCGVEGPRCSVAHIAMDGMELLVTKDVQHGGTGDVAGMDDDIAVMEAMLHLVTKVGVRLEKMGIGEDACSDRHENGLVMEA